MHLAAVMVSGTGLVGASLYQTTIHTSGGLGIIPANGACPAVCNARVRLRHLGRHVTRKQQLQMLCSQVWPLIWPAANNTSEPTQLWRDPPICQYPFQTIISEN